jgi:putative NADH-flavin reductase
VKKILVLGGVGAMATETTIDLVQTSDFDELRKREFVINESLIYL